MIEEPLYQNTTVIDLFILVIVLSLSIIIARALRTNLRRALKDKVADHLRSILEKFVYYTIIIIGVIIVLPQFGINLTGLLVAGGFIGIIIGFASQSVVANFVSGLFLIFERPVRIGDQIGVGDVSGVVKDIRILSTIVQTYEGTYVRIPNEKVFSSEITNFVAYPARRFEHVIGVSYSEDAEKAIQTIGKVLEEHPFVLKNPAPNVFVDSLGEYSVNIVVRAWAPSTVWYEVKCELLWKLKVQLDESGIIIPFHQRIIHFAEKKLEDSTLPNRNEN